jgi:hypothetical protein
MNKINVRPTDAPAVNELIKIRILLEHLVDPERKYDHGLDCPGCQKLALSKLRDVARGSEGEG